MHRAYGGLMLHTLDTICLHDPSVGPTVLNARAYAGPLQFSFPHSAAGGLPYACDGPPVMVIRDVHAFP